MARKETKDKAPIKLRRKKLANGNTSLFLDVYIDGQRRKEYLKLYLIPEKSSTAKEQNIKTLEIAETIRAERIINLQANKSEFFQKENKTLNTPFVKYMEKEVEKMKGIRTQNYIRRYTTSVNWVKKFDSKTALKDVDKRWIQRYLKFLSITPGKYGKILNQNTIHEYLIYIANVLNNAVREGLITSNPTKSLNVADRPKKYESKREFLTAEEIKKLVDVPSPEKYNNIRGAFLFSCFSGLRYSDIQQLRWEHIKEYREGVVIEKKLQKTQNMLNLPLGKRAISFLPERKGDKDSVFKLPKSMATVEMYIKLWSEFAKIDKHVTFHTARHTFAVSILTCGGDIYTLSKLLGHKKITTTQIYADILEETKKNTMNLLDTIEL